jgi:hypothetical protein
MSGHDNVIERNRVWHEWADARSTIIPSNLISERTADDVLTVEHEGRTYLVRSVARAADRAKYEQVEGLRIGRFDGEGTRVVLLPADRAGEHDREMAAVFFSSMKRRVSHTYADSERAVDAQWFDAE